MVYIVKGDIRGHCGHEHRCLRTAARCSDNDHVGCQRQGGYSDRRVARTDQQPLSNLELGCLSHHQQAILQTGNGCGCLVCAKQERGARGT